MSTKPNQTPEVQTLPSRLPAPTGNIIQDSIQSAIHILEVPCARDALLPGIASGVGMGVLRGLSTGSLVAGHWAVATFTLISLGSWHICQKRYADERKRVTQVIESIPKRTLRERNDLPSDPISKS